MGRERERGEREREKSNMSECNKKKKVFKQSSPSGKIKENE